jgi:ABC-type multidrug transport system fused ATPase/permease subunit
MLNPSRPTESGAAVPARSPGPLGLGKAKGAKPKKASRKRGYGPAMRTLARYGRPHVRWLALGTAGSIGVVLCRLAIPWPLRWALEVAGGEAPSAGGAFVGAGNPILEVAAVYLAVALALGISELVQRVNLGRFSSLLVGDLRTAAVRATASRSEAQSPEQIGDLTARVIGDSARARSDLNGILVHASTNGLLFLAVSGVMFTFSSFFGLLFLGSGMVAIAIGAKTSRSVEVTARRQRKKEGRYAGALRAGLEGTGFDDLSGLNQSSGQKQMLGTRLITQSSMLVHAVLGASVCIGLVYGANAVQAGTMAAGELFLFVAYALTVHRRLVQVGRQAARTGKLVASTNRLQSLLGTRAKVREPALIELQTGLHLRGAKIRPAEGRRRARMRTVDTTVVPGSKVAVLGHVGSGKSSLLRLLAGREPRHRGEVMWGDESISRRALSERVGYVPESPEFPSRPLRETLGLLGSDDPKPAADETLRRVGARRVIRGLPDGLDARVGSFELTSNEARAIDVARLLLSDPCAIWILDGVLEGLPRKRARRRLDEILERAEGRTLVLSMSHAIGLRRFDRVLALRRGRIAFDGTPAEWKSRGEAA